ncbi:MAG: hypothetical protein QGD94_07040 [Planctomycetia bacterium]|nr:hypothetical protein [Planctomycetia bacterium]
MVWVVYNEGATHMIITIRRRAAFMKTLSCGIGCVILVAGLAGCNRAGNEEAPKRPGIAPAAASAKRPGPVDGERYVTGEFALVIPRGWRNMKDLAFRNIVLYLNGDGIGAAALDETRSPLQIGMTVEKFPNTTDSLDEGIARLIVGAKRAPRVELIGDAHVESYILSDGTEARLLVTEFIKERYRRSLQMKLIAKDRDSNGWVASAWIVGSKDSGVPSKGSTLAAKMRAHVVSFCFDKTKLVKPEASNDSPSEN